LREQLNRIEQGLDPINIMRGPAPGTRSCRRQKLPCHTARTSDEARERGTASGRREMSPLEAFVPTGTNGSNPVSSSRQSVSAVNAEAVRDKARTLAAFCGWLGT
jgi:hypothetical protein